MRYRVLAFLAAAALLVGVVVLTGGEREGAAPVIVQNSGADPGYAAKKAHLIQTGPDGRPVYTLDAAEVEQQPDEGTIELQQVQLGFRDAAGQQWTARGKRGELAQNSGIVRLEGAVHVAGLMPETNAPTELTTERLAFDTNTQVIATRDPVTLTMSGHTLAAEGLVANLKDGRVQLESAVHGSYHR